MLKFFLRCDGCLSSKVKTMGGCERATYVARHGMRVNGLEKEVTKGKGYPC